MKKDTINFLSLYDKKLIPTKSRNCRHIQNNFIHWILIRNNEDVNDPLYFEFSFINKNNYNNAIKERLYQSKRIEKK